MTSGLKAVFTGNFQALQNINSQSQSQAQSVQTASQLKADRKSATLQSVSQIALSTIMLFTSFISPVAVIFGTYATQIGMGVLSTVKEVRYKHLLNKIIDSYSEANVQDLLSILAPSKVADAQTNLVHNELSPIISKEHSLITDEQKNKGKSENLLQKTFAWVKQHKKQIAMYAGVAIVGFLVSQGINALFSDSMFGSLAGSVTSMGLGTIGMVKQESTSDKNTKKVKIQQTLDGKSLLPPKVDRIISREFGGKKHYTQEYMKNLWKLGKTDGKDGNYIFGMIYQWTHEKSGKVHVYPGRTERRRGTPNYRPYSSISIRFHEEIKTAIKTSIPILKKKKSPMYYDMRVVYDNAGEGQKGINAIVKNFKFDIVELLVISESYEGDVQIIEQLEDYWSDVAILQGYELYTKAGGSIGAHVLEEKGGHGRKEAHEKAKDLIRHGFSKKDIAQYFGMPYSPPYGSSRLNGLLAEALEGKSYTKARNEYVGSEILNLIDNGVLTISELSSYFRGMSDIDLFMFLKTKHFTQGNLYLSGLISSAILKLRQDLVFGMYYHAYTYSDIMEELGLNAGKSHLLENYMTREMKTITNINDYDLISWLRPYAKILIRHSNTASELLALLNWDKDLTSQLASSRIERLFGINFKQAKMTFTNGFLNE